MAEASRLEFADEPGISARVDPIQVAAAALLAVASQDDGDPIELQSATGPETCSGAGDSAAEPALSLIPAPELDSPVDPVAVLRQSWQTDETQEAGTTETTDPATGPTKRTSRLGGWFSRFARQRTATSPAQEAVAAPETATASSPETADWSLPAGDSPATDPGWVLHEAEKDGYDGWLYHFADGATVTEDGEVVELSPGSQQVEAPPEPDDQARELSEVEAGPPAQLAPEPEAVAYAEPDPASDAEPLTAPEPEPDVESSADAEPETLSGSHTEVEGAAEPEAQTRPEPELDAEPPREADAQLELELDSVSARSTVAAGVKGEREQQADAATEPESEREPAGTAAAVNEPEPEPEAEPEDEGEALAAEQPDDEPEDRSDDEGHAEPDPSQDRDEDEGAPEKAAEAETEAGAEDKADAHPEDQPEDQRADQDDEPADEVDDETRAEPAAASGAEPAGETAQAETESEPSPEHGDEDQADFPSFVAYSPSHLPLYALGALFVVFSVISVLMVFLAVQDGTTNSLLRAGAVLVIALASAWLMLGLDPTVVSVRDGVLEVNNGSSSQKADLRDPNVVADSSGKPASPAWKLTVRRPDGKPIVVRGYQVRRRTFARIVAWHQAHPHARED